MFWVKIIKIVLTKINFYLIMMQKLHIMKNRKILIIILWLVFLLLFAFLALWFGKYNISFVEYKTYVFSYFDEKISEKTKYIQYIVEQIRLPRILAALLVGSSLSISGAVFQGIFVNPLVSPGILGVLSGASFGAAVGMLLRGDTLLIQGFAFCFGFLAVFVSLMIARIFGKNNSILLLVLGGVISSALFSAMLSFVKYIADPYSVLPEIVYWLMGSLAMVSLREVFYFLPWIIISTLLLMLCSKQLNILTLGSDEANSLGVDVNKVRFFIIILATILSSLSVMMSGMIGWIGLVVPHIARMIIGSNYAYLLPMCAIIGGFFLLAADSISRNAFATELPLGIVTSLVCIPIFLFVLYQNAKKNYA